MITTEQIKELRDITGISIMQCKKALEEAGGDMKKALVVLNRKSHNLASKKAGREFGSGAVQAYIHNTGAVGAMVILSCETDFVAKNEEFKALAYEIAMQVAATDPSFLKREDIKEDDILLVREMMAKEVSGLNKNDEMKEKILQGKIDGYFNEKILLEQPFIKDESLTIKNMVERAVQKFGERIEVTKFVRYSAVSK
ncbi:MAG: elongation factor Ts [Patescibacteria group bacterium]